MKTVKLLIVLFLLTLFSCSNEDKTKIVDHSLIVNTWLEVQNNDSDCGRQQTITFTESGRVIEKFLYRNPCDIRTSLYAYNVDDNILTLTLGEDDFVKFEILELSSTHCTVQDIDNNEVLNFISVN